MTNELGSDPIRAGIVLQRSAGRVGGDRIALLQAIRRGGSISAAAREVGLSYKAAWDAVQVMNNLFEQPLVIPALGGRDGGASRVSAAGDAVIAAFDAATAALTGAMAELQCELAGNGGAAMLPILWSITMKTSARNVLRGTVTKIIDGAVNAEVVLRIADGIELVATVTRVSVADLGLVAGTPALALIKSSFVILACGANLRTSARNALHGTVVRRDDGPVSSEVTLDLRLGKSLTATLTRESADTLDLRVGTAATALIKASHVILAVD